MKFTAALELENNWHITLCFCDANKRLGKVKTWHDSSSVAVIDVQYWSNVDLTVLLVAYDGIVSERHEYYLSNGYTYEKYNYKPHITVAKGDKVSKFQNYIGKNLNVIGEYVRIFA